MPTFRSTQLALTDLNPITKLNSSFSEGKLRVKCFDWTGDAAQNDLVQFCTLPKGSRILDGLLNLTAFGVNVTIDVGDSTTENKYLSGSTTAAAGGTVAFASTWALYGLGREALATDTVLTAKLEGADPGSGSIYGYVQYMVE